MDRIANSFSSAQQEDRSCFVAYVCAGDPNFEVSVLTCRTLIESGVDILELGVPFSDPLADGLTNQLAAQRALESGFSGNDVFNLVKSIREYSEVPIVLYTYYNLIFSQGIEAYVRKAKEAGVDGFLTLDLPPEEAGDLCKVCEEQDIKNIFIIAPTTSDERMKVISKSASGFIYYVPRTGVTGVSDRLSSGIGENVQKIKTHTKLPVVVGFGISTREHVKEVARSSDGVVVGSALVNCIGEELEDQNRMIDRLRETAVDLVAGVHAS
jgi:tryptophan synthase alpha chain